MAADSSTLVALTPTDLPAVQHDLVAWCDRRIAALTTIVADLRTNLAIATRNRWGSRKSLESTITRESQRIDYYAKIKAALEAGYLIVPNFPVDAFAVRVKAGSKPRFMASSWESSHLVDVEPKMLPAGDGVYVDDKKLIEDQSYVNGENKTITRFVTSAYDPEIDFPLTDVKPVILQAAERALARRIFDSIGLVQERKKQDPILVGTIYDPADRYRQKRVTFFLAWWLDLESL